MVVFQVLTWETQDTEDEHLISIFGKTNEGKSVCVTTSFTPYFFVKLPKKTSTLDVHNLYTKTCSQLIYIYVGPISLSHRFITSVSLHRSYQHVHFTRCSSKHVHHRVLSVNIPVAPIHYRHYRPRKRTEHDISLRIVSFRI